MQTIEPSGISTNLIYKCLRCNAEHWISSNAAKVVGYMIVCDCGQTYKTKPISKIKIIYKKKKTIEKTESIAEKTTSITQKISDNVLSSCINVLIGYGYNKSEAESIIQKTYDRYHINDVSELMKLCFTIIGESVNEC